MKIRWSTAAADDLVHIVDHIRQDDVLCRSRCMVAKPWIILFRDPEKLSSGGGAQQYRQGVLRAEPIPRPYERAEEGARSLDGDFGMTARRGIELLSRSAIDGSATLRSQVNGIGGFRQKRARA